MPEWKQEIQKQLGVAKLEATREAEIVEELAQHMELLYEELLRDGVTAEEARHAILEEFSENESLAQEIQQVERAAPPDSIFLETRRQHMIGDLWRNLRYSVRVLRKDLSFTLVAVLTLALGIGATTAIFSVVYATLFDPMPYTNPDQLVIVWSKIQDGRNVVSAGDYLEWQRRSQSFQYLGAGSGGTFNLATPDRPEQVEGSALTPGFLNMLGNPMLLGRDFLPEESELGKEHVVVLSHRLWSQKFGSDREIIGKEIRMNGEPYTVVGIMQPGQADRLPVQLWVPLAFKPEQINHQFHWLIVIGRLRDGIQLEQAQTEIQAISTQLAEEQPQSNTNWSASVEPLQNNFLPDATRRNLWLLLGVVSFLLLIACVNIANLLLARGTTRHKEVALRAALGATRGQLFSQFLTESLLLAVMGGIGGIVLGSIIIDIIVAIIPPMLPSEAHIRISIPVLLFTLVVTMLAGVLFGCAPAWRATRFDLNEVLKQGGRTHAGTGRRATRRALIVLEFALALTLLAGGGLALHSFWNLTKIDLGVRTEQVLTFVLPVSQKRFPDVKQINPYYRQLLEKIEAVPGIEKAAVTTGLPLRGAGFGMAFSIVGTPVDPAARPGAAFQMVTPGYFETFGIRLLQGRSFTDQDTAESTRVAIVNENFVRRYLSDVDPLKQRLAIDQLIPGSQQVGKSIEWQIIGVINNVRSGQALREDYPEIYVPFWQSSWPQVSVAVRTTGAPENVTRSIAAAVNSLDPDLPLAGVKTMEQIVGESLEVDRFGMVLYGSFAVLALLLSAVGIYGVMAFIVGQRRHEFGIRMALGAGRAQVLSLVLREGLLLAFIGIALGLAGAYMLGSAMQSTLYGVEAMDVGAFSIAAIVLLGSALLACYLPALRASRVDPMEALRHE
jgi:putative ABC transport system permease protein